MPARRVRTSRRSTQLVTDHRTEETGSFETFMPSFAPFFSTGSGLGQASPPTASRELD